MELALVVIVLGIEEPMLFETRFAKSKDALAGESKLNQVFRIDVGNDVLDCFRRQIQERRHQKVEKVLLLPQGTCTA